MKPNYVKPNFKYALRFKATKAYVSAPANGRGSIKSVALLEQARLFSSEERALEFAEDESPILLKRRGKFLDPIEEEKAWKDVGDATEEEMRGMGYKMVSMTPADFEVVRALSILEAR